MKYTAKELGTIDFIVDYICNDIEQKIINKVYLSGNIDKEYVTVIPTKYKDNKEVINGIVDKFTQYGYQINVCKNKIEDDLLYLQITW